MALIMVQVTFGMCKRCECAGRQGKNDTMLAYTICFICSKPAANYGLHSRDTIKGLFDQHIQTYETHKHAHQRPTNEKN